MNRFHRAELLFGEELMGIIKSKKVIVFGIGGVGSWCVESLVRTGIQHITLVDYDTVAETNINRQLQATTSTVGRQKTEALKEHLLDINSEANVCVFSTEYNETTAEQFNLDDYDYIVDAIDSLDNKALLIRKACETKAKLYSSMGAALKLDPTRIAVTEFWKVRGCPLAAALRRRFKKSGIMPRKKFKCVYSEELLKNVSLDEMLMPQNETARANGSLVHITAIYGFTIAGLILQDIRNQFNG